MTQQKQLEAENKSLREQHHDLSEELRKMSKDVFLTEENWNELMMLQVGDYETFHFSLTPDLLQNYYYILQDSEWRQSNDWIHVDSNGAMQSPLQAVNYCKTRNIRPRTDCCGFSIKTYFDNETSKQLERMKSISPASDLLKKVTMQWEPINVTRSLVSNL